MNGMIDDQTLDRQLREAMPYIDDDGFTARVMARLPAVRPRPQWLRAMVLLGLTILGSAMAWMLAGPFVRHGMVQLANFPIWLLVVLAFGCGLILGALAVVAMVHKTPEARDFTRLRF
jgi:hypothetical protein